MLFISGAHPNSISASQGTCGTRSMPVGLRGKNAWRPSESSWRPREKLWRFWCCKRCALVLLGMDGVCKFLLDMNTMYCIYHIYIYYNYYMYIQNIQNIQNIYIYRIYIYTEYIYTHVYINYII